MRRLLDWFRSLFLPRRRIAADVLGLSRKVDELIAVSKTAIADNTKHQARMRSELETAHKEKSQMDAIQTELNVTLDAVRSSLNVAEKVTIPALIRANKLFHERWGSQIAIEVQNQVVAETPPDRGV